MTVPSKKKKKEKRKKEKNGPYEVGHTHECISLPPSPSLFLCIDIYIYLNKDIYVNPTNLWNEVTNLFNTLFLRSSRSAAFLN